MVGHRPRVLIHLWPMRRSTYQPIFLKIQMIQLLGNVDPSFMQNANVNIVFDLLKATCFCYVSDSHIWSNILLSKMV